MENDQFFKDETPEQNPNAPKDYWEMFKTTILDQAKEYPDPVPVINIIQNSEKYVLLTLKSYSLWQGKSKSKKTTALAMAIAAYIAPVNSADAVRFEREGAVGKVLFIDNEQGQSYAARTMNLVLKLAGLKKSENLIYCDFREFTPQERLFMIHAAMDNIPGVKILVVDGVVDVMEDFMDAKEGHLVITDLLRICSKYNVHVAGVLHQNKADKNARAHVGTISAQKCEMEVAVEKDPKDKAQSIVECRESRGLPFEPFAIRWDKGQWPCIVQDYQPGEYSQETVDKKKALDVDSLTLHEHKALVEEIYKDNQVYNDGQLKDQIKVSSLMSKGKVTDPVARLFVTHWHNQKLIVRSVGARNANLFRLPISE